MLLARVREGLRLDTLPDAAHPLLERFERMGYLRPDPEYFNPTLTGRLMVDYMVRELVDVL